MRSPSGGGDRHGGQRVVIESYGICVAEYECRAEYAVDRAGRGSRRGADIGRISFCSVTLYCADKA